jgi:glucose-6-phosphate 1-epimerase
MSIESDEQTRCRWPAQFRLEYRVVFGPSSPWSSTCTNTGKTDLRFEEALHTYNRLADVANVRRAGSEIVQFLDNIDSNRSKGTAW